MLMLYVPHADPKTPIQARPAVLLVYTPKAFPRSLARISPQSIARLLPRSPLGDHFVVTPFPPPARRHWLDSRQRRFRAAIDLPARARYPWLVQRTAQYR